MPAFITKIFSVLVNICFWISVAIIIIMWLVYISRLGGMYGVPFYAYLISFFAMVLGLVVDVMLFGFLFLIMDIRNILYVISKNTQTK